MNNVILKLTPVEAKVLNAILASIGGDPEGTRGISTSISRKLDKQFNKFRDADVDLTMTDNDQIDFGS